MCVTRETCPPAPAFQAEVRGSRSAPIGAKALSARRLETCHFIVKIKFAVPSHFRRSHLPTRQVIAHITNGGESLIVTWDNRQENRAFDEWVEQDVNAPVSHVKVRIKSSLRVQGADTRAPKHAFHCARSTGCPSRLCTFKGQQIYLLNAERTNVKIIRTVLQPDSSFKSVPVKPIL